MADDSNEGQGGGQRTYTVKAGDTLSKISQHFYGDPQKYEDIYFANRDKIENPDNLSVGIELTIPEQS
ncbi:MAG: P-type Cu2+ transporter [Blastocatellia bacterium]|jgi:5'-nucleotidase/UDP-sugar diphosphatase|nr:P-type Cu2+ transporter [Blastocatellia bacterium]